MLAVALSVAAAALTPVELRTLSTPAFAYRLLGAAGALVIDADRLPWPDCIGRCASTPDRREPVAPAITVTFYLRAHATNGEGGWSGLCVGREIGVDLDAAGRVANLGSVERIGIVGPVEPVPADRTAATRQHRQAGERCSAPTTTRAFLYTADPWLVARAAVAVARVHDRMAASDARLVTCANELIDCGSAADLRHLADRVAPARILAVSAGRIDGRPVAAGTTCVAVTPGRGFGVADDLMACVRDTADDLELVEARFVSSRPPH